MTLADVEEAATPLKRFDPEPSSPSHGSEDSWQGLKPPQLPLAAPLANAPAFPYIVQPFDHAQAGGPQGAMQVTVGQSQFTRTGAKCATVKFLITAVNAMTNFCMIQ